MSHTKQPHSHNLEYSRLLINPDSDEEPEVEIRTFTGSDLVKASYSLSELRGLVNQINDDTPIQHLIKFTVTGDTSSPDGSKLEYNPMYGIYELSQSDADYPIPYTPEDLQRVLIKTEGVETELRDDHSSYRNSLPPAIYLRKTYENHLVYGGSTACGFDVAVAHPTADSIVPIGELPKDRLAHAIYTEGLCTQCSRIATDAGLTADLDREDSATPICPVTGEQATGISYSQIAGTYLTLPDGRQEITTESFEEWRRGERSDFEVPKA